MRYLMLVPLCLVCAGLALFSCVLPAVVESCSEACSSVENVPGRVGCFFSAFFRQCMTTSMDRAFIATFLAFAAALITISHVEAARLSNQPSAVLTRPNWTWIAVNAITGAVVAPSVLFAHIKRRRDGIAKVRETSGEPRRDETIDEFSPLVNGVTSADLSASAMASANHRRELLSIHQTCAIPTAVGLGFVAPSAVLLVDPSPVAAGLWNLFPVAVWAIKRLTLKLLHEDRSGCHYAERCWGSVARLYAGPIVLSVTMHPYLVGCWLWPGVTREVVPSAVQLMQINFWIMAVAYLYWLLIEGPFRIVAAVVLTSCLAGPGAGISLGWVIQELNKAGPARSTKQAHL